MKLGDYIKATYAGGVTVEGVLTGWIEGNDGRKYLRLEKDNHRTIHYVDAADPLEIVVDEER